MATLPSGLRMSAPVSAYGTWFVAVGNLFPPTRLTLRRVTLAGSGTRAGTSRS